jgi:hypothetical protein
MQNYFALIDRGYDTYVSTGDDSLLQKALSLAEGGYGRQNPMLDHLFLRISQPDAFNTLYLTPAIIWTYDLNDQSFALTQEMTYKPTADLELRSQLSVLYWKISNSPSRQSSTCFGVRYLVGYWFAPSGGLRRGTAAAPYILQQVCPGVGCREWPPSHSGSGSGLACC